MVVHAEESAYGQNLIQQGRKRVGMWWICISQGDQNPCSVKREQAFLTVVHAAQVDLFVNYDCDLQAANLFERTVRGLARVVRMGDPGPGMLHMAGPVVNVNAAARPRPHVLAADVALAVVRALDAWAEPLKASHPSAS